MTWTAVVCEHWQTRLAFLGDGAQKAGFKMKKTAPLDFEARIIVG